jgi:hypothetical protein
LANLFGAVKGTLLEGIATLIERIQWIRCSRTRHVTENSGSIGDYDAHDLVLDQLEEQLYVDETLTINSAEYDKRVNPYS